MKTYRSYSSDETKLFGNKIAKKVSSIKYQVSRKKGALILALKGDLGSGKTTFTQGFLRGLGVKARVNSPTFVLMKCYRLHDIRYRKVYHLDCYRIKKPKELLGLGLKEIFDNPENMVLIEWPERIRRILPKKNIEISFKHSNKENIRILATTGRF